MFLLCTEGFSALVHRAEKEGLIAGMKICLAALSISHLFFVDDSLFLICVNEGMLNNIKIYP
jgi:hypothetical protein